LRIGKHLSSSMSQQYYSHKLEDTDTGHVPHRRRRS